MRLRSRSTAPLKVEMQMTSMIDVVFQLLAFFIVSFKIVQQEGDLAIKMPAAQVEDAPSIDFSLPLQVHLQAGAAGELAGIQMSGQAIADTQALRARVEQIAAAAPGDIDQLSVNLICDPALRYEHAMAALTAVSGKRSGDRVLPLASNVRLVSAK